LIHQSIDLNNSSISLSSTDAVGDEARHASGASDPFDEESQQHSTSQTTSLIDGTAANVEVAYMRRSSDYDMGPGPPQAPLNPSLELAKDSVEREADQPPGSAFSRKGSERQVMGDGAKLASGRSRSEVSLAHPQQSGDPVSCS
jgi:hypothetical protein